MPMNRALYPANWNEIAWAIKEAANWQCQQCGRPCRKPGVEWDDFVDQMLNSIYVHWVPDTFDEVYDHETGEWGVVEKPGRFKMSVAHLNHIPSDCRPENLKALCNPCHCRDDLRAMPTKRRLKAERLGQLTLDLGGDGDAA